MSNLCSFNFETVRHIPVQGLKLVFKMLDWAQQTMLYEVHFPEHVKNQKDFQLDPLSYYGLHVFLIQS
jgi:hypothetical protein